MRLQAASSGATHIRKSAGRVGRTEGETGQGRGELTLTIGGHVRHAGVLHHACRTSARHHRRIGASDKAWLATRHASELVGVVHHLLAWLSRARALLHMRVLIWRWGGVVEGRRDIGDLKAVAGSVHGWDGMMGWARSYYYYYGLGGGGDGA